MGKITFRDSEPDDPMYSEPPRSYSPTLGRDLLQSKTTSPASSAGRSTGAPASGTRPASGKPSRRAKLPELPKPLPPARPKLPRPRLG